MPLDDGPFPCGRTYVYVVRGDQETFPLKHIYLSYSTACDVSFKLAQEYNKPFHIDVYEETYNHIQLKHGYTYKMNNEMCKHSYTTS